MTRVPLAVGILAVLLLAAPAFGQRYGQWYWDGSVGLLAQADESDVDGTPFKNEWQSFRLAGGLGGYLLTPTIGNFHLGLDGEFLRQNGSLRLDTKRIGGDLQLGILPKGPVPIQLWFRQSEYDYSQPADQSPYAVRGLPSSARSYGASLRVRQGVLQGLYLGAERNEIDPLDSGQDRDVLDRETLNWSGQFAGLRHSLGIEHRFEHRGQADFETDDLTTSFNSTRQVAAGWSIYSELLGLRRGWAWGDEPEQSSRMGHWGLHLTHTTAPDSAVFGIDYGLGLTDPTTGSSIQSHNLDLNWRSPIGPAWWIGPTAGIAYQTTDGLRVDAPYAGVVVTWDRKGDIDATVRTGARYVSFHTDRNGVSSRRDALEYDFSGSMGTGSESAIRLSAVAEYVRNEIRDVGRAQTEYPDLGAGYAGVGSQDRSELRVAVAHVNGGYSSRFEILADRLEARDPDGANPVRTEQITGSWDLSYRAFSLNTRYTHSEGRRQGDVVGSGNSGSCYLSWSPVGGFLVRVGARQDRSDYLEAPSYDVLRYEAGANVGIGKLALDATAYTEDVSVAGGPDRRNRGFRLTLIRRFSGWLPFVSGAERRGEIR